MIALFLFHICSILLHNHLAQALCYPCDAPLMIRTTLSNIGKKPLLQLGALTDYFENDLVSVKIEDLPPRLFVVRPDGTVSPLCTHEDDVPTDVYIDPRMDRIDVNDDQVVDFYGEGYYSQRVVPSLGGGLGYGAEADDVWSIDEDMLDKLRSDNVELPNLDFGIAHGEKARGGAI